MTFQIKNLKDVDEKLVNIIIYGESGVGKTSLVKSLNPEECLFLSSEAGLLCLDKFPVDYVDELKTVDDCQVVLDKLKSDEKYKYVFVDSITELSQNQYELLKRKYERLAMEDGKKPGSYNMQIWGDFLSAFSKFFKTLRDMEKNVIALALLKDKEEKDGSYTKGPDIYGKTQERIIAWFDECLYMHIDKEGNRKVLTQPVNNYKCKDRSDKLEKIENANIKELFKKFNAPKQK